jgi:O-antigen/teichoic acid export membrane protein
MSQDSHKNEDDTGVLGTILSQSGGVFAGSIVVLVIGFGSNFVLARYFGSGVVGRYALVLNVVTLVGILSIFGFDQGLVKYVPQYRETDDFEQLHRTLSDALSASTFLALLTGGSLVAGHDLLATRLFDDPDLSGPLFWAGCMLLPHTLFKVLGGLYKGFKYAAYYKFAGQVLLKGLFLVGVLILSVTEYRGIVWVVGLYFVAYLLVCGCLFAGLRSFELDVGRVISGLRDTFTLDPDESQRVFFAFSGSMILISAVTMLGSRIDIFMLGIFVESSSIGRYKIAMLVANAVGFALGAINAIFPSFVSELFARGAYREMERLYSTLTRWIILLNLPPVLSMCFFPEPILAFFGSEYTTASNVLIVLALGRFANASVGSNGHILKMGENERLVFVNNALMAAINVVLNLLLIPRFGIVGAAIATALSTLVISYLKVYQVKTIFDISPYEWNYLSIPLGGGLASLVAILLRPWVQGVPSVVGVTMLNAILVVGIMYVFRDERDRQLVRHVRSKLAPYFDL